VIIKNGIICSCEGTYKADIHVENDIIKAIGLDLPTDTCDVIDAQGGLLLPGGVDVHTHMDLDLGNYRVVDDFYTGTVAAAFGGTTTIVDHLAFGPEGCSLKSQIERYHSLADGKAVIDYSFHGVIQHVNDAILEEMDQLVQDGITSFKIYMTYNNMLHDEEIMKVLVKARELGAVIAVHAENNGAIQYLRDYYGKAGMRTPIYHAFSRPDITEAEAVHRMICLSEMAGFPNLYFVHISTKKGLDEIISARKKGAANIYCETCTQYLTLTEKKYKECTKEALKYIMAPPLRKEADVEALWEGVANNDIDVIATDHCPFLLGQKLDGRDDFRSAPGGIPGVEERMELILTEGAKRGVPLHTLISKLSSVPAKIFGLYPRKGAIRIGSDADIIIVKKRKNCIRLDNRHSAADYSAFDGYETDYKVEMVMQRGRILVDKDKLVARKGNGEFLKRSKCTINSKG